MYKNIAFKTLDYFDGNKDNYSVRNDAISALDKNNVIVVEWLMETFKDAFNDSYNDILKIKINPNNIFLSYKLIDKLRDSCEWMCMDEYEYLIEDLFMSGKKDIATYIYDKLAKNLCIKDWYYLLSNANNNDNYSFKRFIATLVRKDMFLDMEALIKYCVDKNETSVCASFIQMFFNINKGMINRFIEYAISINSKNTLDVLLGMMER